MNSAEQSHTSNRTQGDPTKLAPTIAVQRINTLCVLQGPSVQLVGRAGSDPRECEPQLLLRVCAQNPPLAPNVTKLKYFFSFSSSVCRVFPTDLNLWAQPLTWVSLFRQIWPVLRSFSVRMSFIALVSSVFLNIKILRICSGVHSRFSLCQSKSICPGGVGQWLHVSFNNTIRGEDPCY